MRRSATAAVERAATATARLATERRAATVAMGTGATAAAAGGTVGRPATSARAAMERGAARATLRAERLVLGAASASSAAGPLEALRSATASATTTTTLRLELLRAASRWTLVMRGANAARRGCCRPELRRASAKRGAPAVLLETGRADAGMTGGSWRAAVAELLAGRNDA